MKQNNILYKRELKDFKFVDTELNKMNRYYVSNEGVELIKKLPPLDKNNLTDTDKYKIKFDSNQLNIFDVIKDNVTIEPEERETNIEAGWKCTLFNTFKEQDDYDLNYQYYIEECYKVINSLTL